MVAVRLIGLALMLSASVASAKEPVVLEPLSPWNLRYEENSCQLVRAFGDKAAPTVMVLERVSPESNLTLMVFGKGLNSRMGNGDAKAAFLPFRANQLDGGGVAETADKKQPAIYWTGVRFRSKPEDKRVVEARRKQELRDLAFEAAELSREAEITKAITGLEITERGNRKVVLKTGPINRAHSMMRECAREQLVHWGVDPGIQDKIVRPAKSIRPFFRLFDISSYPPEAVRKGDQSVVKARLLIDNTGSVTSCTSLTAYRAPGFSEVVCDRLKRAKFHPAELADGTKVPTYETATIKFVMP